MSSNTGIVILAAGGSSRMQQPKQLLKHRGKTLIRQSAETALQLNCQPIVIVTGAVQSEIETECADLQVTFVHNPKWPAGMATSIRTGVDALQQYSVNLNGVLIMLADQPLITVDHLQLLLTTFKESTAPTIVATGYAGIAGVPAVFDKNFFEELKQLRGDKGARDLFKKHTSELATISFEGAAIDVDTPEDYQQLQAATKKPDHFDDRAVL